MIFSYLVCLYYIRIEQSGTSITKILEFRETLHYIRGKYPLSAQFGLADTRKHCLESSIKVFKRLLRKDPDSSVIHFTTIASLAVDEKGDFVKEKGRSLMHLFRPDRDGNITMLNFIQACDNVYKDVRTLTATINNSAQLDDAVEGMANGLFYFVLSIVVLQILGMFVFVLTFWSYIIIPFTFLFKNSVSIWFEVRV